VSLQFQGFFDIIKVPKRRLLALMMYNERVIVLKGLKREVPMGI